MSSEGKVNIYGDGKQSRDFICVKDVVRANEVAFNYAKGFDVFNVGSGKSTSFNELAALVIAAMGNNSPIGYTANPLTKVYQLFTQAEMSKTKESMGFSPEVSLEEGVKWMVDYYKPLFENNLIK